MDLKENIKRTRLDLGFTLDEVAKKVGVSKPTLQRYESGVISNIPSDKVEKLAEVLQTTPAKLMGWNEKKEENNKDKLSISPEHKILLEKYNLLDDMGKCAVNAILDVEVRRCSLNK